ncbi:MAG: RNA pseudouridine synthase [Bacteroidetes bacterium]|nr:MAG: RNA pseudouridine synthase [Bacteroidota bacterium]
MRDSYHNPPEKNHHSAKKAYPSVIFENDSFVVLNKPSGMLSVPDREGKENSLKDILQEIYGKIFTVHRLDRDTSGLIIFAKEEGTHKYLSQLFEGRLIEKFYLGLVPGSPVHDSGTVDVAIMEHPGRPGIMVTNKNGKESITDYKVLEKLGPYTWMEFQIHTGRTHQVRVHMKYIGHPLACDSIYGDGAPILLSSIKRKFKLSKNDEAERPLLNRLALHSWKLKFKDQKGNDLEFEAPLPKDLSAMLHQLEKWTAGK